MRISIVIPCYNAEGFAHRALSSALEQTHADVEIICVDDGSTDGTLALLRQFQERSPERIQVITQVNQGACAARNNGLAHCTGTYVEFLDADDRLLPEKLAHQADVVSRHGLPDLLIGSSITRAADGSVVEHDIQRNADRDPWMDLMQHKLGGTPQNLWKRTALQAVNGWNTQMASSQEYDLMFRLLANGASIAFDDVVLTEIHQLPGGSISRSNLDRNWTRFAELRAAIIRHLRTNMPKVDTRPHYQVLFDSIRTLYPYAPERAVELYERHIPKDFRPGLSPATGKGYLLLHGLFGFTWANRLRHAIGKSATRKR